MSWEEEQTVKTDLTEAEAAAPAEDDASDIEDISEEIRKKPKKKKEEQDTSVKQFRTGKKKWVKWVVIALIALAVIGFFVYRSVKAKKELEDALANGSTTTAEIKRMDISKAISTTGTIQSKDVRTITSPLAGVKIDEVNCKVGDMVQAGDVIVTFSREDINKKIGQIEEDITEEKKAKSLDGGDRTNTYVKNYDLDTYGVATAYDTLNQRAEDLQKAKDELQRACDDKTKFKELHEEAKEKVDEVQEKLIKKTNRLNELKAKANPTEDEIKEMADLTNETSSLSTKVSKYRDALDNYDTRIETLETTERSKQDAVDTAQRNYDDAYVKYNKAGYDASFNGAKSDYDRAKGELTADDKIRNLERQKEQNEDSLDNYIVTAPISGLVTAVNAQEGNGYQATTGALLTIQAVDIYEVTTQVDEYDINNVRIGQSVAIMTDATGDDELEGVVTFIAPTATSASSGSSGSGSGSGSSSSGSTFEVRIDISKKDDRLRFGMTAKLNILIDTHKNVLAVPYDAIEEIEGGKTVIYVEDPSAAPAKKEEGNGITVVGIDGLLKSDDAGKDAGAAPGAMPGRGNAKEIPVQVGLESDYYTEVISPEISEGMTVLVNSDAGVINSGMDMMMGF